MRLIWTEPALSDLQALRSFIELDKPGVALNVVERILDSVDQLALFPNSGRVGRVDGTRELIVPGLPFIIAYRIDQELVEVLRVLHGARRWPARL